MKRVQCEKCGRIWDVSAKADTAHGYLCPDCEDKIMLRPRRSFTGVWTSGEEEE